MRITSIPRLHTLGLMGSLLFYSVAVAAQPGSPGPDKLVHDGAHVLEPAVVARLERQLERYADSTGVQLAVVTVASLHGQEIGQLGDSLKNAWGIGSKQTQRGILYLIAPGVPRQTIRTGRGIEADLPDALCFRILKQSQPTLRQDPQAAILARVAGIQQQLAKAAREEATAAGPAGHLTRAVPSTGWEWSDLFLLLYLAVALSFGYWLSRRNREEIRKLAPDPGPQPRPLTRKLGGWAGTSVPRPGVGRQDAAPLTSSASFYLNSDDDDSKKSSGWGGSSFTSDSYSNSSFDFGGDSDAGGGGASSD